MDRLTTRMNPKRTKGRGSEKSAPRVLVTAILGLVPIGEPDHVRRNPVRGYWSRGEFYVPYADFSWRELI